MVPILPHLPCLDSVGPRDSSSRARARDTTENKKPLIQFILDDSSGVIIGSEPCKFAFSWATPKRRPAVLRPCEGRRQVFLARFRAAASRYNYRGAICPREEARRRLRTISEAIVPLSWIVSLSPAPGGSSGGRFPAAALLKFHLPASRRRRRGLYYLRVLRDPRRVTRVMSPLPYTFLILVPDASPVSFFLTDVLTWAAPRRLCGRRDVRRRRREWDRNDCTSTRVSLGRTKAREYLGRERNGRMRREGKLMENADLRRYVYARLFRKL